MKRIIGAAAIAAACLVPAASASASFNYGLIGDTPYGATQITAFPSQIAVINNDPSIRTTIHAGDIKNGSSRCDTSYFNTVKADFDQFAKPLVYTPGDNEWTDCHRANNGGYQPAGTSTPGAPVTTDEGVSRLDKIRQIFFANPKKSLGGTGRRSKPRVLSSQGGAIPENQQWSEQGVVFATFNLPGSNNDKLPWFGASESTALASIQADEVATRTAADIAWLKRTFKVAENRGAPAVVLTIQADMWDPAITGDPTQYDGFTSFVQQLAASTLHYGKPVLLVNGDSHVLGSDFPLSDAAATNNTIYGVTTAVPNLKRITVNGSGTANLGYVRLTVDPSSPSPFSYSLVPFV